jgi:hypothetical protein
MMVDDRCECGKELNCPPLGAEALALRTSLGIARVVRTIDQDGCCRLRVEPVDGGAPISLGVRCRRDPEGAEEKAIQQLHMRGYHGVPVS